MHSSCGHQCLTQTWGAGEAASLPKVVSFFSALSPRLHREPESAGEQGPVSSSFESFQVILVYPALEPVLTAAGQGGGVAHEELAFPVMTDRELVSLASSRAPLWTAAIPALAAVFYLAFRGQRASSSLSLGVSSRCLDRFLVYLITQLTRTCFRSQRYAAPTQCPAKCGHV